MKTPNALTAVDLRIIGSDAEKAGRLLGMSWNPFFVYDQFPDYKELEQKLKELVRTHNLNARFEVVSPRIPHREPVNLALKQGAGAGEIQFHGIWAAVIAGVPIGQSLRVVGERLRRTSTTGSVCLLSATPDSQLAILKKWGTSPSIMHAY